MDDEVRAFGTELGGKALGREWALLEANDVEGIHYPEGPEPQLGGNGFTKATELREPISFAGGKARNVTPEVTDENVGYWLKLQLLCSEEQEETLGFDALCEVWIAVVQGAEGLRVGYWSQGAY